MARVYSDVNEGLGPGWYDYGPYITPPSYRFLSHLPEDVERLHIDWSEPDRYEIIRRVGGGKYSEVRSSYLITILASHLPSMETSGVRGDRHDKRGDMYHQSPQTRLKEEDQTRDQNPP